MVVKARVKCREIENCNDKKITPFGLLLSKVEIVIQNISYDLFSINKNINSQVQ